MKPWFEPESEINVDNTSLEYSSWPKNPNQLTNIAGSTDLKAGDKLKFEVSFLNAGKKVITGPFDIVIMGGTQEQGRMTVSESFDPGTINSIVFESTTGMMAGTSDWKIVLDDGNTITEASETDNEFALGAVPVGTAPLAVDFSADPTSIEISELVNDGSIKFTPTVTGGDGQYTYNWTFTDGSPATSNEESPEVTYSAEGNFDVTLKVTDGLGETLSETKTGYISVILVSGIDDDISDIVSIYPNSTANELKVNSSLLQNARLYLWNTSGQIMNVPIRRKSNKETIMNVTSLNNGVYILEIITSDKKLKSRILINK